MFLSKINLEKWFNKKGRLILSRLFPGMAVYMQPSLNFGIA